MEQSKYTKTIKRILGEFFLIVIGVTIALWLENELENLKEREVEQSYIESFESDWSADATELEKTIAFNKKLKEKTESLFADLFKGSIDDKALASRIFVVMSYQYFTPQDFTFQSMRETGDFRLIKDKRLRKNLLKLKSYHNLILESQANYQQALDNYIVPLVNENVDIARQQIVYENFKSNHRLSNLVAYTISDLDSRIKLYEATLNFLNKLRAKNT